MKTVTEHSDHEEERLSSFCVARKDGTGKEGGERQAGGFQLKIRKCFIKNDDESFAEPFSSVLLYSKLLQSLAA